MPFKMVGAPLQITELVVVAVSTGKGLAVAVITKSKGLSLQSLFVIAMLAVFAPLEAGVNVTENTAVPPGRIGDAGVNAPAANIAACVPPIVMLLTVRFPVPVFCMV